MRIVKKNVNRLKIPKGFFVVGDGRNPPFKKTFSKILLDVPCSGLGVIRKHPDIKWRRNPEEIKVFSILQSELLRAAIKQLADDGKIVYSTCSIDPMENEQVIENVLKQSEFDVKVQQIPPQYTELADKSYIKTFPHTHHMDGSFCAIIKKFAGK
jgi:16S rRNA (cytosine967-C5)-methyltransferase